jgi:hypothetical protein
MAPMIGSAGILGGGVYGALRVGLDLEYLLNTDATDSSGNGRTGTAVNSPTIDGKVTLDGSNQYINTNYIFGNALTDWTISMWVNADSWTGNRNFIGASDTPPNRYLVVFADGGKLDGVLADGTTTYGFTSGATTLSTATWYHIAYTFSGGTVRAYINGTLDANYPQSTGITSCVVLRNTFIGARNHVAFTDQYFDGMMDDVRFSTRALSVSEIDTLYNLRPDLH